MTPLCVDISYFLRAQLPSLCAAVLGSLSSLLSPSLPACPPAPFSPPCFISNPPHPVHMVIISPDDEITECNNAEKRSANRAHTHTHAQRDAMDIKQTIYETNIPPEQHKQHNLIENYAQASVLFCTKQMDSNSDGNTSPMAF